MLQLQFVTKKNIHEKQNIKINIISCFLGPPPVDNFVKATRRLRRVILIS